MVSHADGWEQSLQDIRKLEQKLADERATVLEYGSIIHALKRRVLLYRELVCRSTGMLSTVQVADEANDQNPLSVGHLAGRARETLRQDLSKLKAGDKELRI